MAKFFALDKILHFAVSLILAAFFGCMSSMVAQQWAWCVVSAWSVTMLIGVVKEFCDLYMLHSKFDIYDLMADFAGAAIGCWSGLLTP